MSIGSGLEVFFSYFTVPTNLLVCVSITLSSLLRHTWSPQGLHLLADVLLHYAVPERFQ